MRFSESTSNGILLIFKGDSKMKSISNKQRGFSLFETMLVAVIMLVAITVIYNVFIKSKSQSDANNEATQITSIMAGVKSTYGGRQGFAGLTTTVMINSGGFPANMVSGTNVSNVWGGAVTVAAANIAPGTNNAFAITYTSVPQVECTALVSQVAGVFRIVTVGGTAVKTTTAPELDVTALTTACAAGGGANTIVMTGT